MNLIRYVKSFVYESVEEEMHNWLSCIVCFVDEGKMVFDSGLVVVGNCSPDYYAHFLHFKNFILINGDLHYKYPDKIKKINPDKVYLHIRVGSTKFEVPTDNLAYWHLYFTSPSNKLYKSLDKIKEERIKLVDMREKDERKVRIEDISNPLFNKYQKYNEHSIMFSGIKVDML